MMFTAIHTSLLFFEPYTRDCRQTKIHNIGATVVGVDKFGNKYYEKLGDTQYGEYRVVLFTLYLLWYTG